MTNHLGNVLVTVSDKKIRHDGGNGTIDYYTADVITANDYYPFGMTMPGRKFNQTGKDYRYSINGQEKESDLNDNITTAEYWEYDSRIGRRWNLDPKPDVSLSPYSVFGNNPIYNSDPFGDTLKNPQILAAIKIANNEINKRVKAGQGFGLQSRNYIKPLSDAMKSYLEENPVEKGDLVDFYNTVHKYYDALAGGAMMSSKDYSDYNRVIINNKGLSEASIIRLTNKYVTEANRNLLGVITISANVALAEAAGAVAPNVGVGPKGVNQNLSFSDVAFKRYISPDRTVPISDLRRAISTKGQPDPQGAAGYRAYYTTTVLKNNNAYNLKVIYNEKTNTIVHFHYSRASMGGLPAIPKPKN